MDKKTGTQSRVNWKAIAIVFLVLFVLETSFMVYLYNVGNKSIENEEDCVGICASQDYSTYYYDDIKEICYCMQGGEIQKVIYLG